MSALKKAVRLVPRYGNIPYDILQDIELAVIALKEIQHMLATHYRCYTDTVTTIGNQIAEFEATQYSRDVVCPLSKPMMCSVIKGLLHERNNIIHREGFDFLNNRKRYINQCMEVFENLSPKENGFCVSPARHSVLVPCPNSQSLFEDLTFIDYGQYEDISIAIKVTKRIDHILREVFHQPGDTLQKKILDFPYERNSIKRKMLQVNAIRNKLVHERHCSNFDNRIEFINLSQSIFTNLIDIVDSGIIRQGVAADAYGDNLDVLSNMTSDINITHTEDTSSTYHIPIHALHNHLAPSSYSTTTGHYEKLSTLKDDNSTVVLDFGDAETSTQKDYYNHHEASANDHSNHAHTSKLITFEPIVNRRTDEQLRKKIRKEERLCRRNRRLLIACKHFCVGLSVIGVVFAIAYCAHKFFF